MDEIHDEERPQRPRCRHCHLPIGVYERLWVRRADGSLDQSSLLNLRPERDEHHLPMWHFGCLAPAAPPEPGPA